MKASIKHATGRPGGPEGAPETGRQSSQHELPLSSSPLLPVFVILTVLLLAACQWNRSSQPANPEQSPSEVHPTPAVATAEVLDWSRSAAENARLQALIDGFNSANPNLGATLNLTPDYTVKRTSALASESPPALFALNAFDLPDLVQAGALAPAGDRLTGADDFYPVLRNAFTLDGHFYCPPKEFSTLALIYNKTLFDAAEIAHPTDAWTWDDLRSAATALTNPEARVAGLALNPDFSRWLAFVYAAGGSVTDPGFTRMTINSPEAQAAFAFLTELVTEGVILQAADLESRWPGEAFGKGKAAMTVEGNWIAPYLAAQFPTLNAGYAELPTGAAGKATIAFSVCYGVPANYQEPEKALRILDYLTAPTSLQAWSDLGFALPPRQSLRDPWLQQFPERAAFLRGVDYAQPWQFPPGFQPVLDSLNTGLHQVYLGIRLPADVLAEAETIGNVILGVE